jgi:hypothetical protein
MEDAMGEHGAGPDEMYFVLRWVWRYMPVNADSRGRWKHM